VNARWETGFFNRAAKLDEGGSAQRVILAHPGLLQGIVFMNRKTIAAAVLAVLTPGLAPVFAPALAEEGAGGFKADLYGSLRFQGEYVDPRRHAVLDDYWGVRDAYSRLGARLSYGWEPVTLFGHLEVPLDLANFRIQGPYEQNDTPAHHAGQITDSLRVGKIGLRGGFGSLAWGQDWLPYYNAIAAPVDMFSSYYSGFGTFTAFRRNHLLAYYSPEMAGFSISAGYVHEGGDPEHNGRDYADRYQLTASYRFGITVLAAGLDQAGGADRSRLYGLSLQHNAAGLGPGDLYVGAKIERFDSRVKTGFGADGDMAANLFLGYTMGQNTFKLMLAKVENYGDRVWHLGFDHQLTASLKLFAEYYNERETAAITTRRGGAADTAWAADGGQVFLMGARFDF